MRVLTLLLLGSLLLASVPVAAASAGEAEALCGGIVPTGVVPWTRCAARYGVCAAWALIWGPQSPCPYN